MPVVHAKNDVSLTQKKIKGIICSKSEKKEKIVMDFTLESQEIFWNTFDINHMFVRNTSPAAAYVKTGDTLIFSRKNVIWSTNFVSFALLLFYASETTMDVLFLYVNLYCIIGPSIWRKFFFCTKNKRRHSEQRSCTF